MAWWKKSGADSVSGVIDTPLGHDFLSIDPYVEGLSRFIAGCQTPMTLAVQGDWGTGKTNLMLLAERKLAPDAHFRLSDAPAVAPDHADGTSVPPPVYTIRFNTWQYSQFDLENRLVASLLENIGAHLLLADPGHGEVAKRTAFLQALLPIASQAGLSILKSALGVIGLGTLNGVVDTVQSAYDQMRARTSATTGADAAAVLLDVKQRFAEAVEELVTTKRAGESTASGRVVIFIDDLDRLAPHRAVELMEALKLFLDVEHCVFVLAIDFAVVEQGVMAKYGPSFDRVKARSFFDKIIQVPFQMPIGAYQIEGLLVELMRETGIELSDERRATFLDLIRYSVGNNPRSIKRLINSFLLLRDISGTARGADPVDLNRQIVDSQLFAILCLQTAYPDAYLSLVAHEVEESPLFQRFFVTRAVGTGAAVGGAEDDDDDDETIKNALIDAGIEPGAYRFRQLAVHIARAFSGPAGLDVDQFRLALNQAITTSSGLDTTPTTGSRGPKGYGPQARRSRMIEKVGWATQEAPLRLPQRLAQRLEAHADVEVGAPLNSAQGWVIEVRGKRIGMIRVHKKFFHLDLEPKWFAEQTPRYFVDRFFGEFQARMPELTARVEHDDSGWFSIPRITPSEEVLVDALADFWIDMIEEDLQKR